MTDIFVMGVGMTPFGKQFDKSLKMLCAEASSQAFSDAGCTAGDVEAIFFGNCVANGIPCLTLGFAAVEEIQGLIESDPGCQLELDVAGRNVQVGEKTYSAVLPDVAQRLLPLEERL